MQGGGGDGDEAGDTAQERGPDVTVGLESFGHVLVQYQE
jgi:hypothetical protein